MNQKANKPIYLLRFLAIIAPLGLAIFFALPLRYAIGFGVNRCTFIENKGCLHLGNLEAIMFTSAVIFSLGLFGFVIAFCFKPLKKYMWRILFGSIVGIAVFVITVTILQIVN